MKCDKCQTECSGPATHCPSCQEPLRPKRKARRRRPEAEETVLTPEGEAYFRQARWVYYWALWSLLPPVGALLGPLAALMAWRLRQQAPAPNAVGLATLWVSFWMGTLTGLTQTLGAALIVLSYW